MNHLKIHRTILYIVFLESQNLWLSFHNGVSNASFLFTAVAKYSLSHVLDIVISIQYALPNPILYKSSAPLGGPQKIKGGKLVQRDKAVFLVIAGLLHVLLSTI